MRLPGFLKRGKGSPKDYYFAVVVFGRRVWAALWDLAGGRWEVLATSAAVTFEGEEGLLSAVDRALSGAAEKFSSEEKEPDKVVLGLPAEWVKEEKIEAEKLRLLRQVMRELELSPVGFVVAGEAIADYMGKMEGAVSAVLVGVVGDEVEVGLVRSGRYLGTETVKRSKVMGEDVVEGLKRFKPSGNLPSRIVVYGEEQSVAEARQLLLSHAWGEEEGVTFLHFPKVEAISGDWLVRAVVGAGAGELGGGEEGEGEPASVEGHDQAREAEGQEGKDGEQGEGAESGEKQELEGGTEEERVVGDEEVKEVEEKEGVSVPDDTEQGEGEELSPETMGFSEEDVVERGGGSNIGEEWGEGLGNEEWGKGGDAVKKQGRFWGFLRGGGEKGRAILVAAVVVMVILAGAVAAWWYLPSARVRIYVAPKTLSESVSVNLAGEESEARDGEVAYEMHEVEVTGEKQVGTSGVKLVGERAGGEVTVFNRTDRERELEVGTELTGPQGLKFSLSEAARVASASSGSNYEVIPGKVVVKVQAGEIGAEYNLAGGTEFGVGAWAKSDLVARSEGDFSGGTSREVQAVSASDRENLEESLKGELVEEAKKKLVETLGEGEILVEGIGEVEEKEVEFSHRVGEEAQTVGLKMALVVTGAVVKQEDLEKLVKEKVEAEVPEGYEFEAGQLTFTFAKEGEEGGFKVVATAELLPRVDAREVAERIAGKRKETAEEEFTKIAGFVRAEMGITPRLPGRLGTLPHVPGKIEVSLEAER